MSRSEHLLCECPVRSAKIIALSLRADDSGVSVSPETPEEPPYIFDQQMRLFQRREVTAPRHIGPRYDVESWFEPLSWNEVRFFWESRNTRWYSHSRVKEKRRIESSRFVVATSSTSNAVRSPIEHQVS